jgi:hypothetical protein
MKHCKQFQMLWEIPNTFLDQGIFEEQENFIKPDSN